MNFYQFSRYSQHIGDRALGPDLRRNTDIRQKIPLLSQFLAINL